MDEQEKKILEEIVSLQEKSERTQIELLREANSMIGWIMTLSSATFIIGITNVAIKNVLSIKSIMIIYGVQVIAAFLHRVYNNSHITYLTTKILYMNLQKIYLWNDHEGIAQIIKTEGLLAVVNRIGNVEYIKEETVVHDLNKSLTLTRRIFTFCGIVVLITFLINFWIFAKGLWNM